MNQPREQVAAQIIKIPIIEATTPKGGLRMVYVNYWWPVSTDECIYKYGPSGSPQCNASKKIVEHLVRDGLPYPEFKEIRQLPFVSFHANPSDYA